jgi:hypothetical protein
VCVLGSAGQQLPKLQEEKQEREGGNQGKTCKSLVRVDLAWLTRPLLRQREANLSQVSISSVGGSTSSLTARRACHTCYCNLLFSTTKHFFYNQGVLNPGEKSVKM